MAFFDYGEDVAGRSTLIRVHHDALISQVSQHAVLRMVGEEIQNALTADPELRILVREMVKESIAKMNLQELVDVAVKAVIGAGATAPGEAKPDRL